MTRAAAIVIASFLAAATPASAQPYSSIRNGDVVQLRDARTQTTVSIVPSVGNIAFEMNVKGQNVLYWPYGSIEEFKARPGMSGIPFLGPWIDRLDEQAFFANGRRRMTLGAGVDFLEYDIFVDAARQTVWGATPVSVAAGNALTVPYYARIYALQDVSVGTTYTDTLIVTFNF